MLRALAPLDGAAVEDVAAGAVVSGAAVVAEELVLFELPHPPTRIAPDTSANSGSVDMRQRLA